MLGRDNHCKSFSLEIFVRLVVLDHSSTFSCIDLLQDSTCLNLAQSETTYMTLSKKYIVLSTRYTDFFIDMF